MTIATINKPLTEMGKGAEEPARRSDAKAPGRAFLAERHCAEVSLMVTREAGLRARAEITTGGLLSIAAIVSAALLGSAVIVQAARQGGSRRPWHR